MFSNYIPRTVYIAALLAVGGLAGCGEPTDKQSVDEEMHETANDRDVELSSAHRRLGPDDLKEFRPGRSKAEILAAVQWRGNFEMASVHKGRITSAISYMLFSVDERGEGGEGVWAIFVDEKFEKFVPWPAWQMETVDFKGTPASQPKKIPLGDFSRLVLAAESEPLDLVELEKEWKAQPAVPSQIDPGLTIAYVLLQGGSHAASKQDYKRNAELRDQFNASRLRLEMTEREVESVLKAKPIAAGETESGSFKIYGSDESFNLSPSLYFANILVIFADGRVSGIYSGETVLAGENWRSELTEIFQNLSF